VEATYACAARIWLTINHGGSDRLPAILLQRRGQFPPPPAFRAPDAVPRASPAMTPCRSSGRAPPRSAPRQE
jgi:hypothetical protein